MSGVLKQNLTCDGNTYEPNGADIFKCFIIIVVMTLIIVGNICCLVVFNSPNSRKHFMKRVRYMMNSLCCTDLCIGLLVCPSTIYPALYHCWPPGEVMCKIEALLISALFHESTLNMVLIAVDRYCIVHVRRYNSFMNSRRFLVVILCTWLSVFSCYASVIFGWEQYYYDVIGINCEPFYENATVTLSVISIFYFLPAVIFIFCYVSIYRTASRRKVLTISPDDKHGKMVNANIRTSKYLAAITAGFFFAVSPWTLCTLIIVAAKVQLDIHVDFFVTWLALSNSFWNCLIYGVMNRKFRRAAVRFICGPLFKRFMGVETITSSSKSFDDSRDFSDDTSAYAQYKRRISRKHLQAGESPSLSTIATPRGTPRPSPSILHRQVTKPEVSGLSIDSQKMSSFKSRDGPSITMINAVTRCSDVDNNKANEAELPIMGPEDADESTETSLTDVNDSSTVTYTASSVTQLVSFKTDTKTVGLDKASSGDEGDANMEQEQTVSAVNSTSDLLDDATESALTVTFENNKHTLVIESDV